MKQAQKLALATLLRQQRWAGLATVGSDGAPQAAMVAYAYEEDFATFYIHVSQLSQHTRHMLQRPEVSLVISEPDTGEGDPQILKRVSLSGMVKIIERGSDTYALAKNTYLKRLPSAEQLFELGDFVMFALVPQSLRFVGGFGQAHSGTVKALRECAALALDA